MMTRFGLPVADKPRQPLIVANQSQVGNPALNEWLNRPATQNGVILGEYRRISGQIHQLDKDSRVFKFPYIRFPIISYVVLP